MYKSLSKQGKVLPLGQKLSQMDTGNFSSRTHLQFLHIDGIPVQKSQKRIYLYIKSIYFWKTMSN